MPRRRKGMAAEDGAPPMDAPPPPSSPEGDMGCETFKRNLRPRRMREVAQDTHTASRPILIYTRGRSIPKCDHEEVDDMISRFHGEHKIQSLCSRIRETAEKHLEEFEHPRVGLGYRAKEAIAEGVALSFYTGRLEKFPSATSRHVIALGKSEMRYNLMADGTPPAGEPNPLGSMQLVNHSCDPNCATVPVESECSLELVASDPLEKER